MALITNVSKNEYIRMTSLYPNKLPIVVKIYSDIEYRLPPSFKYKYMVPSKWKISKFIECIKNKITTYYCYALDVNLYPNINIIMDDTIENIQKIYNDEDGFIKLLFIFSKLENNKYFIDISYPKINTKTKFFFIECPICNTQNKISIYQKQIIDCSGKCCLCNNNANMFLPDCGHINLCLCCVIKLNDKNN
jgi:hypothetical protein